MKISIDKTDNKKDYLDETYYIMSIYRKLYKNPNKKIRKKTTALLEGLIFILIYFIVVTVLAVVEKSVVYYICIGISIVCLALIITRFIATKRYIDKYSSDKKYNSELLIDEEKIVLNNKAIKQETSINWEDLNKIILTNRCIVFMKKINKDTPDVAIIVPNNIKDKVFKALEKYNKEKYIVYNKKDM